MLRELAAQAGRPGAEDDRLPVLSPHGSLVSALLHSGNRALPDAGLPLIAELKRASPSAGILLQRPAAAYLQDVKRGGACAISAVTAGGRFQGSPLVLRDAHAAGLPTLMKDFVTQTSQLDLAVQHGASAVLLIERLLERQDREGLVRQAHDRGLEVLLELHGGGGDAAGAATSRADLLGVNSRDLDTLSVDVPAALRRVRELARVRPTLLLSGVADARDAETARQANAAGVLVGTSLLVARDSATSARALRRSVVKVCGNRTTQDVLAATGADLVGVVVGTDSPRDVELDLAAQLLRQAERQGAASVAATRHQSPSRILDFARELRPTFLQVHGFLATATVTGIQALGVGVLQGLAPGDTTVPGCDGTVSDATPHGGSGLTHAGRVPATSGLHLVAGGLDASNVQGAIARSAAVGADASSRLETAGRKDPAKVAAFIAMARRARRQLHGT